MRLALRLGDLQLELAAQVVGDGDQRGGAADDEARCGGDSGVGADVADVAPVGRDDQRRAGGDRGGEAGRDQEVRVHDIGAKSPRDAGRLRCEPEVTTLAAGARVEHRALDLVPPVAERALDLSDERAQIGVCPAPGTSARRAGFANWSATASAASRTCRRRRAARSRSLRPCSRAVAPRASEEAGSRRPRRRA